MFANVFSSHETQQFTQFSSTVLWTAIKVLKIVDRLLHAKTFGYNLSNGNL